MQLAVHYKEADILKKQY